MAVLPDCLDHHDWSIARDGLEDLDPHALAINESVAARRIGGVSALHRPADPIHGGTEVCFELFLGRPAFEIRGLAEISVGDGENCSFGRRCPNEWCGQEVARHAGFAF